MSNDFESTTTETLVNELIRVSVPQIIKILTTEFSYLAWGPVPSILAFILPKLLKFCLKYLAMGSNKMLIRIDITMDVKRIEEALRNAHDGSDIKTTEEVRNANEEIKQALRNLVSIGRARL